MTTLNMEKTVPMSECSVITVGEIIKKSYST